MHQHKPHKTIKDHHSMDNLHEAVRRHRGGYHIMEANPILALLPMSYMALNSFSTIIFFSISSLCMYVCVERERERERKTILHIRRYRPTIAGVRILINAFLF